jgi:eukaryotic-like serine/threonine-protein kinase
MVYFDVCPVLPAETGRFGRYRLLARISVGGTAEVFDAMLLRGDGREERVVLKRMLPQYAQDPTIREIFREEARVLASLDHPNVVRLCDFGALQGTLFLALEHIDGGDLDTLLARARAQHAVLSPPLAASVALELSRALDYIHTRTSPGGTPLNIVHRDVSPQNVLVSTAGKVKLADFGIARWASRAESTVDGSIEGKIAFMAPEQATEGRSVDARADLFSLGSVLYEALFDHPPFSAATDEELLECVRSCQYNLQPTWLPPPHRSLVPILRRCLQRSPDDRYPSASALGQDLARYLDAVGHQASSTADELAAWVAERVERSSPQTEERIVRALFGEVSAPGTAVIADRVDPPARLEVADLSATRSDDREQAQPPLAAVDGATADSDGFVGRILNGTYRILRAIKSGGMGVIYEAEHLRLPSLRCAVKISKWTHDSDGARFARFQREAEIVSMLRHPNIVRVIDFDRTDEMFFYLVMDLLEGEDLESRLRRSSRLKLGEVRTLVREIGGALGLAHERGIVHRDLKPSNIFLAREGDGSTRTKLLDFGISKALESLVKITSESAIVGTASYMSPEQARGDVDDVDLRSDIFSLATIIYRCLTGLLPFRGPNETEIRHSVCRHHPPPVTRLLPGLPAAVDEVLTHAHAKRKEDRYARVVDFVDAVLVALGGDAPDLHHAFDVRVDPVAVPDRGVDPDARTSLLDPSSNEATATRSRPALLLGGLGVVLVAALVVGWLWGRQKAALPRPPPAGQVSAVPKRPPAEPPTRQAASRPSAPPSSAPSQPTIPPSATERALERRARRPAKVHRAPAEKAAARPATKPYLRYDEI